MVLPLSSRMTIIPPIPMKHWRSASQLMTISTRKPCHPTPPRHMVLPLLSRTTIIPPIPMKHWRPASQLMTTPTRKPCHPTPLRHLIPRQWRLIWIHCEHSQICSIHAEKYTAVPRMLCKRLVSRYHISPLRNCLPTIFWKAIPLRLWAQPKCQVLP